MEEIILITLAIIIIGFFAWRRHQIKSVEEKLNSNDVQPSKVISFNREVQPAYSDQETADEFNEKPSVPVRAYKVDNVAEEEPEEEEDDDGEEYDYEPSVLSTISSLLMSIIPLVIIIFIGITILKELGEAVASTNATNVTSSLARFPTELFAELIPIMIIGFVCIMIFKSIFGSGWRDEAI